MYFLDTCLLIDVLRKKMPYVRRKMEECDPGFFGVPSVVYGELLLGAFKSNSPQNAEVLVEKLIQPFAIVPFDARCARTYARIRADLEGKGCVIGPNDLIIAATALANEAVLVTSNRGKFKRVCGLRLEEWAEADFPSAGCARQLKTVENS